MANVPHSTLTGSDLHIIKGADIAAAGQVPVATGSGDAPFGKLTHTSLQTTGNPFGAQLLHVQDQQNSGSTMGTASANVWNGAIINTILTNEISGASLASNEIILPPGTYFLDAIVVNYFEVQAGGGADTFCQTRFRNASASTTTLASTVIACRPSGTVDPVPIHYVEHALRGRFVITGAAAFDIQRYTTSTVTTNAWWPAIATGEPNVFLDALIWKLT